ncbi:PadR family transcriptional regulator, partial [Streptomyces sp. DT225]
SLARTRERLDDYTLELQRHGMESVEREVRWLNELIESERSGRDQRRSSPEGSAQQKTAGEPDGLPRRGDNPPDPSGDTAK